MAFVAAWFRQGTLSIDCLKGLADQRAMVVLWGGNQLQKPPGNPNPSIENCCIYVSLFVYLGVVFVFTSPQNSLYRHINTVELHFKNAIHWQLSLAPEVRVQELTPQLCILQIQEHIDIDIKLVPVAKGRRDLVPEKFGVQIQQNMNKLHHHSFCFYVSGRIATTRPLQLQHVP